MLEVAGGNGLRVSIDPDHGGRIVSLRHDDLEWLAPSSPAPAGATAFVHAGTGGWDEALPTVSAGGGLPDHGDLWNTAWEVHASTPTRLLLVGRSASSGVTLERTITATAYGIDVRYRATTGSETDRPFLWSAHPLFAAEPGTMFELPGVESLREEYPTDGASRSVPPASWLTDAGIRREAVKAFVRSEDLVASPGGDATASVVRGDDRRLTLSWSPAEIPWLGLYWDTGEFGPRPVLALEPTSAGTDHATRAPRPWLVRRGRPRAWGVHVSADRR